MATATKTAKQAVEFIGTGRRKRAVSRVRIKPGKGKIVVNGRDINKYLPTAALISQALAPLTTVDMRKTIDARIAVHGGGHNGQAGAISHSLARALEKLDSELRPPLKKAGHITRDGREKERKKPGQPGARKKFQFSKR